MRKDFFFQVWAIYRDHWGIENYRERMKILGRQTIKEVVEKSVNVRHLFFLYGHFPLGMLSRDIFTHIKDFADACLGDEIDYFKTGQHYDPLRRNCAHPSVRYYQSLGNPVMNFTGDTCECLQRVYALLAFFPHLKR